MDTSGNKFEIKVEESDSGARLDAFISGRMEELTRCAAQKLISEGFVTVGGGGARKNYKVKNGDLISIELYPEVSHEIKPENIPIAIAYEDDDLLVVNKPKGMVVHPAPGNYTGTLVNALTYYCGASLSGINGVARPGIVHRIDKDTSGLLIVAKNDASHRFLAEQIKTHSFKREYEAVVNGIINSEGGVIDAPIGRSLKDRKKMAVTLKNSRGAVTHYKVVERYEGFTRVELRLLTGRTHQIRVHMASIGRPVAGDGVYGKGEFPELLRGQCLHAKTIGFVHPFTKKYMEIRSELPDYFKDFIKLLKV